MSTDHLLLNLPSITSVIHFISLTSTVRIPRRVTTEQEACLTCGLDHLMVDLTDSASLIIISSSRAVAGVGQSASLARAVKEVEARNLPVFLLSFPPHSEPTGRVLEMVKFGGVFAVEQSELIQAAVMTILGRVDRIHSLALHHSRHLAGTEAEPDQSADNLNQFSGQFVLAEQREATLRLTLTLPDQLTII